METPPTARPRNPRALRVGNGRIVGARDVLRATRPLPIRARRGRGSGDIAAASFRRDAPWRTATNTPQEAFPWAGLASR